MVAATDTTEIRPHAGPQTAFLSSPADIAIYGGAAGGGKSWALVVEPLRHVHNPKFKAVVLRKTYPEIMKPGGLWDEVDSLYPFLGAEPRLKDLSWTFDGGAKVEFGHMADKYRWQGSQVPLICFDELTHFDESEFWWMVSRNRSTSGVKGYIRATCNPDADSWVAEFIAWWIDEDSGYPIYERSGRIRWFVRRQGELIWADTKQELIDQFGVKSKPKSVTFIPALLEDNPTLETVDPEYRANLEAMPYVERERLLRGNWRVRSTDGAEFPGEYFDDIWPDRWPDAFEMAAMGIDPSKGRERGDYSAIIFAGLASGVIWIDADIARRPVPQIAEDVVSMFYGMSANALMCEGNMFQDIAMQRELDIACDDSGLPPLPVNLVNNMANKKDRIRTLGMYFKRGLIRFRPGSEGCKLLESQLRGFPLPDVHDDGPDAMEMAIRQLNDLASETINAGSDADFVAA